MFDLKLQRTCDHTILDETATINGLSPNYFSILKYQCDGASNFIVIREFSATEGLSNFVYIRDGFTNWNLSTDKTQINWNTLGMAGGVSGFVDASSHISPTQQYLVNYRVHPDLCPICFNNLGLAKDIDFNLNGSLLEVTGTNKVKQLIFKALLTELESNSVLPNYGSTISASIGQKYDVMTEFRLHNSIERAVRFLIDEQQNQVNLPLDETILNVSSIRLAQDVFDPRIIRVTVEIQVADFTRTQIGFSLVNR